MDSPLKIVVIEDHDALREMTVQALKELGCVAVGVSSAEEFDEVADTFTDIYVIDLNLPGEDGVSLSKRIRAASPHSGIIIISARKLMHEKLAAYESGADFYLTKPTSLQELGAVILAFKRRSRGALEDNEQSFKLDTSAMRLYAGANAEEGVPLSHHEVLILSALAKAANNRLESWQLIQVSESNRAAVSKSTLEVQILRLRKKMTQVGASQGAIKGIRGHGYQLCVPLVIV